MNEREKQRKFWYDLLETNQDQLPMAFLEEHQKSVSWLYISRSFTLTKELFERFPTKMDTMGVICNPSFTLDLLDEIKDIPKAISWQTFSEIYPIDEHVYKRFANYIETGFLTYNDRCTLTLIKKEFITEDGEIRNIYEVKEEE